MRTEIGQMIREAMQRKGRETGSRYTFRDLERDSGVDYTYAARVAKGERKPSREVVQALAKALAPFLPVEEAMVAAGFVEPGKQSVLSRLARRSREALEYAEQHLDSHWSEPVGADEEAERKDAEEEADDLDEHPSNPQS